MFARFLPALRQRYPTARILFQPQAGLRAVLADITRHPVGDDLPATDFFVALNSLPHLIGHGFLPRPYLAVDPQRLAQLRPQLPPGGFRIGLSWQGNPANPYDRRRSIALARLAPLAGLPGVSFLALQQRHGRDQIVGWPGAIAILPDAIDFADTAAAMACCDLVITIDSAVAHLAGALGRPVWTLLSYSADWRWLEGRTDSPWYPSMRLFRQPAPGDWPGAVEQVRQELSAQTV